jgi:CheY-like chemotaxis protein
MQSKHRGPALRVWLVDDSEDPHRVADLTIAGLAGVEITHFYSGAEALQAFAELAGAQPGQLPAVILMDFFIGDERGDVVTSELRRLEPASVRATIVGYSSMASASERILASGGDVVVRKHRSADGVNPSLYRFLLARLPSR